MLDKRQGTALAADLVTEGSLRSKLLTFYTSDALILILTITIIFNVALTAVETDYDAEGTAVVPAWVHIGNYLIFSIYFLEFAGRLFIERTEFHKQTMNLIDLAVLILDFVGLFVGGAISSLFLILRGVRLIRVSNSVTVMMYTPELAHMLRGLVGALKALAWGTLLVLLILTVWGILAVRIIHPLNQELTRQGAWEESGCERCPRAFQSVMNSMLTFTQQILAGDSWGQLSIPIIEHYPETILFFSLVLLTVQLAIINLILAVILDKANESRQQTDMELLAFKETEQVKARKTLVQLCKEMDADGSGHLSFEEILAGFETHADFQTALKTMDIEKEDISLVFRMLDYDDSGAVAYEEFADQLFKMRTRDIHTMVVFIRFYVSDMWRKMRKERASTPHSQHDIAPSEPISSAHLEAPQQQQQSCEAACRGSAWSEKLRPELLAATSGEREDVVRMLGSLTDKLDAHTQKAGPGPAAAGFSLPASLAWGAGGAGEGGAGAGGAGGGTAVQAKEVALDSQPIRSREPPRGTTRRSGDCAEVEGLATLGGARCRATHEEVRRLP